MALFSAAFAHPHSLSSRVTADEILDGHDYSFEEYEQTLIELELINRLSRAYRPTLDAVAKLVRMTGDRAVPRVLDVGSGGGDMLRAIAQWAKKKGVLVELEGVDINPWAEAVAERRTPRDLAIRYRTGDVFALKDERYDLIVSSLFTHHLSEEGVVRFLSWMTAHTRKAWFVNDLHRHKVPYLFTRVVGQFSGFNRVIANDAPLSVARAFRRGDWERYLERAGLNGSRASIEWHWPFRYGVFYDCTS